MLYPNLAPPLILFDPLAIAANATISVNKESDVVEDENGFLVSTNSIVAFRCKFKKSSGQKLDLFPDGADIEGELLEGRMIDPKTFPDWLGHLTTCQINMDDGRVGFGRLTIKTQNSLLGDSLGSALGMKFYAIFRPA